MDVKSFMFYDNYYLLINLLPDEEQKILAVSVLKYMFENIEPNFEPGTKCYSVWINLVRALNTSKKNSINGKKGGAPEGNNNATKTIKKTSQNSTENQPKKQAKRVTKKQTNIFSYLYLIINNSYKDRGLLRGKIKEWLDYKIERNEPYKETGFKSLLTQINNNCAKYGESNVINLIDECMASNYKGIIFDKLKNKKEPIKPEWMDKEIKAEKLSPEEQKEMEQLLSKYR